VLAVEIGPVLLERAVREAVAPMADQDGTQQDAFDDGRKDGVPGVDGILDIAQLMSEANLPLLTPALLRPQPIRHPEVGAHPAQKRRRHGLAP